MSIGGKQDDVFYNFSFREKFASSIFFEDQT